MIFKHYQSFFARPAVSLFFASALAAISLLIVGASSAQQPDSRPRQTGAPSATPPPQPTATPLEQTGPGRRIAPQLGAPPPAPILKPKPTPPPDPNSAEISEGERLTINTELVTLHVRVIDRNNHPINNIRKDDFKVLEDNVPDLRPRGRYFRLAAPAVRTGNQRVKVNHQQQQEGRRNFSRAIYQQ
ncbi:MAG: hypothetical protein DMF73_09420 [Acidobacteria bacterium]|nr:MAG: hypothetical protein DMF73_09420 [Acidobacteriota bacterium]